MIPTKKSGNSALAIAALGVVYGDIGTSPLYALKECFNVEQLTINIPNVLGFLSLIFWAIIMVVTLKYVVFVLQADNKGEGGVIVLMQEARRFLAKKPAAMTMMLGLVGAALFYGDAIITPAISVLSAAEGLVVVTPSFEPYIIPIAVAVLISLFAVQHFGTAKVGKTFGPIMLIWFLMLAMLGVIHIIETPLVLKAINPWYAFTFIHTHGWGIFLGLGAVVLALTGAEALYADMGHFGKKPIRRVWFSLVLPSLCLNYFGQGALLLTNPAAIKNPFFLLAPSWGLLPLILLATIATVIASQAVISGAFSLSRQAIQLGFSPRMKIIHTSVSEIGQIYLPAINSGLLICVLMVIVIFQSSNNLAAAYGIAVTGTMLITSLLFFIVMHKNWKWPLPIALGLTVLFLAFDLVFFIANLLKLTHGGWLPVMMAMFILLIFTTWIKGRRLILESYQNASLPLAHFLQSLQLSPPQTVPGTAIFLTSNLNSVPQALLHNLKHNKVIHEQVIFMTIITASSPLVEKSKRLKVEKLSDQFMRISVYYGFHETPNMTDIFNQAKAQELVFDLMETSFFLSKESIAHSQYKHMNRWRVHLFMFLNKNGARSSDFFHIPANRVVEMGLQIEI